MSVTCRLLNLLPLLPLVLGASVQSQAAAPAGEGPFAAERFARRVGPAAVVVPTPDARPLEPPLFDREGRSNELIVQLNHDRHQYVSSMLPSLRQLSEPSALAVEMAAIRALAEDAPALRQALGQPLHARHLLQRGRMDEAARNAAAQSRAPEESLQSYLVLRYASVADAQAALPLLKSNPGVLSVSGNNRLTLSLWPNDPYFAPPFVAGPTDPKETRKRYQWGMHAMNFPSAWDTVRGNAYVGIVGELGVPVDHLAQQTQAHVDLRRNHRWQFGHGAPVNSIYNFHAMHVAGIVAAQSGNQQGVAGGCLDCSVSVYQLPNQSLADWVAGTTAAIESGLQVLNWSGDGVAAGATDCSSAPAMCSVMELAKRREVLLVQSTGNFGGAEPPFPSSLYSQYWVLPVGGTEIEVPTPGAPGASWYYNDKNRSTNPGKQGVVAPAKSVVSLSFKGATYNADSAAECGDLPDSDESTGGDPARYGDGYGSCTGTSMAAPHVSALSALLRSVNPLMKADTVRSIVRNSGNLAASGKTVELGWGLPNAKKAVAVAVATNPQRLTPLFSLYSDNRSDSFYTTVPQMARAALNGTLKPRNEASAPNAHQYSSAYGLTYSAYTAFPDAGFVVGPKEELPRAEVLVFTTPANPKNTAAPLVPLYRLSWKCGDHPELNNQPLICSTLPSHTDTTYTADAANGVAFFESLGYSLDGIEGYIYPKDQPQPKGTVKLMRKYNPTRDDHAIFPESRLTFMLGQGYTENTGSDWLGYVYPNTGKPLTSLP